MKFYHSSKWLSSCWIWHVTFSWLKFFSNKLEHLWTAASEFFVFCNIKLQEHLSFYFVFSCVLFHEHLTVLHHSEKNFYSIWHLYQIHTFNNNLNNEEMITSHLICVIKQLFYGKNIVWEKKNSNRKTTFFQNSTRRLLLVITVSIVTKAVLANETTATYDPKLKHT